jgi:hypothetical protein
VKRKLLWISPFAAFLLGLLLTAVFYPYFFTDLFSSNNDIGGGGYWIVFILPAHCVIAVAMTSVLYAVNRFRTRKN